MALASTRNCAFDPGKNSLDFPCASGRSLALPDHDESGNLAVRRRSSSGGDAGQRPCPAARTSGTDASVYADSARARPWTAMTSPKSTTTVRFPRCRTRLDRAAQPFLNSMIPLPSDRPTSGSRLPKRSTATPITIRSPSCQAAETCDQLPIRQTRTSICTPEAQPPRERRRPVSPDHGVGGVGFLSAVTA